MKERKPIIFLYKIIYLKCVAEHYDSTVRPLDRSDSHSHVYLPGHDTYSAHEPWNNNSEEFTKAKIMKAVHKTNLVLVNAHMCILFYQSLKRKSCLVCILFRFNC